MKQFVARLSRTLRQLTLTVIVASIAGTFPAAGQTALPGNLGVPGTGAAAAGAGGGLDAARNILANRPAQPPNTVANNPNAQARATVGLTDDQRLIATRFCDDRLRAEERDALLSLRNFSPLEQDYCRRARELLLGFGYETFDGVRAPDVLLNGAIPESYRLGIGDELVITMRGQVSTTASATVDREGRIIINNLAPIPAVGRTFGEFRRDLQARIQAAFIGTDVFVSLGSVRMISVSVVGEVTTPGIHQLTGLSTVVDAIALAGGIRKTGSLRRIMVERRDAIFWIDVYDLLLGMGSTRDLGLYEGDRIVVPALGATVAVAGKVRRPAIYELPEGATTMTVAEALELAGGTLRAQGARATIRTFDRGGREMVTANADRTARIIDGDLLVIDYGEDIQVGAVRLDGAVRVPGARARATASSVRSLVGSVDGLAQNAYLPFAVLETTEPTTQSRMLFPVNLQRILAGEQDFTLRDRDRLVVFSTDDIRFLSSPSVQRIIRPTPRDLGLPPEPTPVTTAPNTARGIAGTAALGTPNTRAGVLPRAQDGTAQVTAAQQLQAAAAGATPAIIDDRCPALEILKSIVVRTPAGRFSTAVQVFEEIENGTEVPTAIRADECPKVFRDNPDLLPFVLEHAAAIGGEVRFPGAYPVTADTLIGVVVAAAGGVTRDADLGRVEFSRTDARTGGLARAMANLTGQQGAALTVGPGDIVRFNANYRDIETGGVMLAGEVMRPGHYDIRRGERLSEVIARAGGLTPQAYPFGSVFTRERVRRAQQEGIERASRDLNNAIVYAVSRNEIDAEAFRSLSQTLSQVNGVEAAGRVVIEADPTVLQVRPELDTVLEAGDTIFIPKRPNSVMVMGDVLNPGALQFVPGARADAYLQQAGGLQRSADKSRIFVVFPNGVAQPLQLSVWNFSSLQIPPGSAVVAPKDPSPLGYLNLTRDVTALVSQIVITLASLTVISR